MPNEQTTATADSINALTDRVAIYFSAYKHYVELKSEAGLLDTAIFGERLARDLLEIVFGYKDLQNLAIERNYPAIDLGSLEASCAVQVTLDVTSSKVAETQQKFFSHGLHAKYGKLKFVALRRKQGEYTSEKIVLSRGNYTFNPAEDIYDLGDLFRLLAGSGHAKRLVAFACRLERELGSAIRPYLLGVDLPGQHLRRLLETHDVRMADAVEALKKFGITRAILSDTTLLTDAANGAISYIADQFGISPDWIDGRANHIYSDQPGAVQGAGWYKDLRRTYDLVSEVIAREERLTVVIPDELSLRDRYYIHDEFDENEPTYVPLFVLSSAQNAFKVDRHRMTISAPLSYKKCLVGVFLLFLAAEMHELLTGKKTYLNVFAAPRELTQSCSRGSTFLVELLRESALIGNQKDYVYGGQLSALIATSDVPQEILPFLQAELTAFAAQRLNGKAVAITTSKPYPQGPTA